MTKGFFWFAPIKKTQNIRLASSTPAEFKKDFDVEATDTFVSWNKMLIAIY